MRRVLEGGAGWDREGKVWRSIDNGEWARCLERLEGEEAVEVDGEEDEVDCCCMLSWR